MNPDVVQSLVIIAASHTGLTPEQIMPGRTRTPVAVRARHVLWYVLYRRAGANMVELGALSGHDHSTVYSGISSVAKRLKAQDEDTIEMLTVMIAGLPVPLRPAAERRASDAHALLDAAERLAPIVEALGHALARMGQQLAATVEETRRALDAVALVERGAA